jgi:hypothetical protein
MSIDLRFIRSLNLHVACFHAQGLTDYVFRMPCLFHFVPTPMMYSVIAFMTDCVLLQYFLCRLLKGQISLASEKASIVLCNSCITEGFKSTCVYVVKSPTNYAYFQGCLDECKSTFREPGDTIMRWPVVDPGTIELAACH